ncbi:MAG: hypothetical protein U9Q85_04605 [Patescibacteria group bacterium]|nr:hypothetical protein [Patescibacteria group bacterium]
MKLVLNKNQVTMNAEQLMRQAGYALHYDRRSGRDSFARRLGRNFYPRFHVYLAEMGEKTIIDLHLDQKRPRYQGQKAHNAEYYSEAVEEEINRIKSFIKIKLVKLETSGMETKKKKSFLPWR